MANTVQIITAAQKERLILENVFKNLGADAVFSRDLSDALAVFERTRPRAVFITDEEDIPAEIQIRELLRVAPFLPIVVLLKRRDSSKALAYMKLGAFDCAQAPWTEEELRPLYKKALNISGTALKLDTDQFEKQRHTFIMAGFAVTLVFGFIAGCFYGFSRHPKESAPIPMTELPYSHPSGLAFEKGRVLVSDWYTQAVYRHDLKNFKIAAITSFPETVPVSLADGTDNVWLAEAGGNVERRMKDKKFTLISETKAGVRPPAGICYDGLYLWTAHADGNRITRHMANDRMTELASFVYPGIKLTALACDRRFLWVADEGARSLVKLSPEDPENVISRTTIPQYESKSLTVTALGSNDGKIWFTAVDKGKGWLFNVDQPR